MTRLPYTQFPRFSAKLGPRLLGADDITGSMWDGKVDTDHEAGRGRGRRIAYDAIPTECAMMIGYAVPRRFTGPKFIVKLASEPETRREQYYHPWEELVPMLRENYVTISINSAGRPHVVFASADAWRAAREVRQLLKGRDRF